MGEIARLQVIELELPVAVSENHYRRFTGRFPIISAAGRKYHEQVKFRFQRSGQSKIEGPVSLHIDFYPPDRRKRDIDNQFKCLLDSLVSAGCIEDDSLIHELHLIIVFYQIVKAHIYLRHFHVLLHAYKREPMPPDGMIYVKIARLRDCEIAR